MLQCPLFPLSPFRYAIGIIFAFASSIALISAEQSEIERLDQSIEANPNSAYAFQQRGALHFMEGAFIQAIADFDRVIELLPEQEAGHWQRGIAYYYAGQYEKGVRQFELHQTVNSNDVENAIWHFICKARTDGFEAARQGIIPIKYDSRVPMMEVWDLFAGKGSIEKVLESAQRKGPNGAASRQSLCYAHLYLGLYYEALEESSLAKRHIGLAANEYSMDNYMGGVARTHARALIHDLAEPY